MMNGGSHEHGHHPPSRLGSHPPGSVTPFPIDAGRSPPPPPPPPKKSKENGTAPSLLEIQQMQGQAKDVSRRDEWVQAQRQPGRSNRQSHQEPSPTAGGDFPPPSRQMAINGPDPPHGSVAPSQPIAPSSSALNASNLSPSQAPLYLPPGARPASPPSQLRPASVTRPSYHSHPAHSQTSIMTASTDPHGVNGDDAYNKTPKAAGRDRGYSSASASGRGGELDAQAQPHIPNGKLPRSPQPPSSTRSPLANSVAQVDTHHPLPAPPHIYASAPPPFPVPHPTPPSSHPPVEEMLGLNIPNGVDRREADYDMSRANDKEKKKFWGGWGGNKAKERGRDAENNYGSSRPSMDEGRRSVEMWREADNAKPSSHGHGEDDHRGRLLGIDLGRGRDGPAQLETVTGAIRAWLTALQTTWTDYSRNVVRIS